ncbi:MAG: acyl-ACP--UDP-N-acetylglucosamine O-acyltransferase [Sneathiella sp.]|nr:acyl-ACP--UDP-N-acetylglucosamine O-acyltransferase [Sneathiella sp.]
MSNIHPSAVIQSGAVIHETAEIGPFCVIDKDVTIHAGTVLKSHVAVAGKTTIGEGCTLYPFASIGHAPQDLKFHGEKSEVIIGGNCVIREHVTINPGTEGGGSITQIGDNCLIMVAAHIAHDCILGNNVILVKNATLGGHVIIDDFAIIGGLSAVHQFVRIGAHAMIGGASGVETDIIPFGSATGNRANLAGLNLTGMKRREFPRDEINALRKAYKILFGDEGTLQERTSLVEEQFSSSEVVKMVLDFIQGESGRGICQPKK